MVLFGDLLDEEELQDLFCAEFRDRYTVLGEQKLLPNDATSDVIVREVVLYEIKSKLLNKVSDRNFDDRCKYMRHILPQPNNFPASYQVCKNILAVEDVWEYSVHFCPMHTVYPNLPRAQWKHHAHDTCGVDGCTQARFVRRQTSRGVIVYPTHFFFVLWCEEGNITLVCRR